MPVKRIISFLLAAVLIFSLSACGKKSDSSDVKSEPEMEFAEFDWPDTEIAQLMPVPKSSIGNIYWSQPYGFVIYVANTSLVDYAEYVQACEDAGFTLDGRKGDDYFWADNEEGYKATVRYEEGDVMFVRIDDPDDVTEEPESGSEQTETPVEEPVETNAPSETPVEESEDTGEPTTDPAGTNTSAEPDSSEESSSVVYSTNSFEVAKRGNSGVFSYKRSGKNYDTYWIVDFDEGCAYWFTDGNNDTTCERVQIDSGDLNEYIVVTYHDGDSTWQYGLSFKRKNQPDRLIEQHTDGTTIEFTATNLKDALELRDTLTIVDY